MQYTEAEIKKILEDHRKWINDEEDGVGADLSGADLYSANLRYADLSGADLSGADLHSADLYSANLRYADLSGADLSGADLSGADLSGADLRYADLSGANLYSADLQDADLSGADLQDAKFLRARDGQPIKIEADPGLIQKVAGYILNHQDQLEMGDWHASEDEWREWREANPGIEPNGHSCGTAHCIAGWMVVFGSAKQPDVLEVEKQIGTARTAQLLCPTFPTGNFYTSNKEALKYLATLVDVEPSTTTE